MFKQSFAILKFTFVCRRQNTVGNGWSLILVVISNARKDVSKWPDTHKSHNCIHTKSHNYRQSWDIYFLFHKKGDMQKCPQQVQD